MALTKKDKIKLIEAYKESVKNSRNIVALKQYNIPVNEINLVRAGMGEVSGKMMVVKKRLFLNTIKELGYDGCDLGDLEGSVMVLFSYDDEFLPLKSISKIKKIWKKSKTKFDLDYLGGWFDKKWAGQEYVSQIADMPSKEELIGKLAYLINYPIQSFAMAIDQIRQKKESGN